MSHRSEQLFSALNQISDAHIDEAAELPQKHKSHWKQWSTAAACITLAVVTVSIFPRLGGCGSSGGNAGHEEGSVFMSYAGPILPLTLKEENPDITAERTVTMDFTPWVPQWWSNEQEAASRENLSPAERQGVLDNYQEWFPEGGQWRTSTDILVTDAYTIANPTNEDQTITVQLPFVGTLLTLNDQRPTLTLDGQPLHADLLIGSASPDYEFSSWEEIDAQLAGGTYRTAAQQHIPAYDNIPVIVYGYQDEVLRSIPRQENTVLDISNTFDMDCSRTGVLDFNYHGGTYDWDTGHMERNFSLSDSWQPTSNHFLIVLGEDVEQFTSKLSKQSVEDVPFVRVESDLDTVLRYALRDFLENRYEQPLSEPSFEQSYALLRDLLPQEDLLNFNSDVYKSGGVLMDYMEQLCWMDRIFWSQAEITIPAGERRTLTANFCKEASFDHACAKTENQGISGYDLMPWVDSNLRFTAQTAVLEDREQIEIVHQNFGFDLASGVKSVPLDPSEPRYYLEVRDIAQPPQKPPAP